MFAFLNLGLMEFLILTAMVVLGLVAAGVVIFIVLRATADKGSDRPEGE